jgi:antitoxin VapB
MTTAKVFMTGRSQAVRIPKEFRFGTPEVYVRRSGDSLVLTPARNRTWDDFFRNHACPAFTLDRTDSQRPQERIPFA